MELRNDFFNYLKNVYKMRLEPGTLINLYFRQKHEY